MATVPPRPKLAPAVAGSVAKAKTVPPRRPPVPVWGDSGKRPQLDLRQPKTPPEPTSANDAVPPPARPSPAEALEEANQKDRSGGDPRQPGGRGARPGRPSQRFRETSRSFERLAEQLGDLRESETRLKHELDDARYKVDDLNKLIATRDAEIAQLQQTNGQLLAWNKEDQSVLTGLPDAGQWKMLYETAEKSRADLQASMQTMCTDHRTQLENMAEEIKAREASRRRELVSNQVEQLRARDRELTQLKQEVLEKEAQLAL